MNHQGKKEKVEPVESLSQRRDQFEAFFFNKDPRVGKTITATLVCGELGFTYIKMNASDTRSKRTLEEQISHSLSNKTMDGFLLSNFSSCFERGFTSPRLKHWNIGKRRHLEYSTCSRIIT
ncbi:replication factor C subunit 1-like [Pocillopora damicornis]|uniref:replication factor C subunit 1-like n=1 Tax=Pocillopora damicornis TaxID=46731 RepID=UPI000F557AD2|nr:replication factor C subunit 1-like [Pocillopora damicornis]